MIRFKNYIFALLCVTAFSYSSLTIAAMDSRGTEFMFAFPPNYTNSGNLSLFISSESDASGTIEIPGLSFVQPISIRANEVTQVRLPLNAQHTAANSIKSLGIRVVTDQEVTVYGLNQFRASTDAFLALPVDVLGIEYLNISYQGLGSYPSQMLVTGVYDGTEVTITPTTATTGRTAGTPFNLTLNAGDSYLLQATSGDLTGTTVNASSPVSVMGAVKCVNVPVGYYACDHIVEMLPPVATWGQSFVTIPLATRKKGEVFRILASENNTQITVNGDPAATLQRGQHHEIILTAPSEITADAPVLLAQYSPGQAFDGVISDPFMMLIPPSEQFLNSYNFATLPQSVGFRNSFVNVIAPTGALDSMLLDNTPVDETLFQPVGQTGFSSAQIALEPGSHNIRSLENFGIYVYGFGGYDSYGYPGGMSFDFINPRGDSYPPNARLELLGDYIIGYATDSEDSNANATLDAGEDSNGNDIIDRRSEDLNGNGLLDEGEDINGDGALDRDTGIFRIELSDDSENLNLETNGFVPGSLYVDFVITRVDSSVPAQGTLIVTDGAGNTVETPIDFFSKPTLTQVSVVSTFSNQDIDLVQDSFSKTPIRIDVVGDQTEVEWTFEQFPTDQVERLTYDLIMRNPVPGETRLVLHDLELTYADVNGNPVVISLGSKAVTVAPSVLTLNTSVDKAHYLAGEDVVISHLIQNLAEFDDGATLNVRIEDQSEALVTEVANYPVSIASVSSLSINDMLFNVGNIATGNYKVVAELRDASDTSLRVSQAGFAVVTASGSFIDLASFVSTQQPEYSSWDTVNIETKLQNMASNASVNETTTEIKVRAPDGQIIFQEQRTSSSIAPSAIQLFYFDLPLSDAAEGQYQVTWTAKDTETGDLLTTSTTTYEVVREAVQDLVGSVTATDTRVFHTGANQCDFVLLNRGNTPFDNLAIAKSIIHVDSEQLITREELMIGLLPDEQQQLSMSFEAAQKTYGGYTCVLEAEVEGTWQVLASTVFEVQSPKITTNAYLGSTKRLLVLTDAPRQCSAFEDIRLGAEFGAELSLNNEITVRLLNEDGVVFDTEIVSAFDIDINNSYGTPTEPDLAVKASASGELEFVLTKSGGMPHHRYQVQVEVKKSWFTSIEKSWSIDSTCDRPLTIGELYEDLTLLDWDIWSNEGDLREIDPYGPSEGPDLNTQNDFIEGLLGEMGWEYTLVHTAAEFAYEHRLGDYGSYLILSERPQLHWKVQKEIREAVVAGKGLIVAGSYDKRNHWLEPALGMDVVGHHPWAREMNLYQSSFTSEQQLPLVYDDRVQGIWLDGAGVIGEYTLAADQSEGWTWLDQNSFVIGDIFDFKRKAITQYEYGDGKSLFFGFDLLMEATSEGSTGAYSTLLLDSLAWIQPDDNEVVYPFSVVPVNVEWVNNRGTVEVYAELQTTGGASIAAASGFDNNTPASATFNLEEGEVRNQTIYVELSEESSQQVTVITTTIDGEQSTVQAEASFDLLKTERPSLSETQAELDSLAWQYWYRVEYRSAWLKFKLARSAFEAGYYNEAQGLFLITADLLMDRDEPEVIAARKSLNSHIETTGRHLALDQ
ncbi:MAG: hypothetical protein ACJA2K_001201 [Thalassolituus sp.]|jgi:hypothetical protein